MSRQVFITGASGYLGTALARRMVESGDRVRGLVRRSSSPATLAWLRGLGVELVQGDVSTGEGLATGCRDADLVIHSAAVIGYRRRLAGAMQRTNVVGTRRVVSACLAAAVGRMLHVSSIAAIGISETPAVLDEEQPYNAGALDAAYFDTKFAAEQHVQAGVARGLDAVLVNPGAIYGPSEVPSNSSRLLQQIVRGQVPFVPAGGINAVPLDTVVDGVLLALERGRAGRRYILGGENLGLGELVGRVSRLAGRPLTPRALPTWLRGPMRGVMELVEPLVPDGGWFTPDLCACFGRWMWFDTARARTELGLVPRDLDESLEASLAQLRSDGRLPPR